MMEFESNIEQLIKQKAEAIDLYAKGQVPKVMGVMAVNFFKSRFRAEGWLDTAFVPWAKRAKEDKGRGILIGKGRGRMRRSIRVLKSAPSSVSVGTDVPYARTHNAGYRGVVNVKAHTRVLTNKVKSKHKSLKGKSSTRTFKMIKRSVQVKAHTRIMNIPKRQFIGQSQHLNNTIQNKLATDILKILKS